MPGRGGKTLSSSPWLKHYFAMGIAEADLKKINVNGIKFSTEQVQINIVHHSLSKDPRPVFFRLLAQHQINIPFILTTGMVENAIGSCCVESEDIHRIKKLINKEPVLQEHIDFIDAVGALTIFPHRSNLKLPGICFYLLGKAGLPIYGMASSISSLTFITDYLLLDEAVTTLLKYVDLPPNHAPFRSDIHVVQKK